MSIYLSPLLTKNYIKVPLFQKFSVGNSEPIVMHIKIGTIIRRDQQ